MLTLKGSSIVRDQLGLDPIRFRLVCIPPDVHFRLRFGGIYDMVGIGRNYDSDRIIARFAIVQRQRMVR